MGSPFLLTALVSLLVLPTVRGVCLAAVTSAPPAAPAPASAEELPSLPLDAHFCTNIACVAAPAAWPADAVVRIDEDWELRIGEPSTDLAAPQVGTVMAPCEDGECTYFLFVLNQRFNPTFAPGGLEVQLWEEGEQVSSRKQDNDVLHHSDETITWTQRLMVKGLPDAPYLCFRVVDGSSESWGSFGGAEPLHINRATALTDLSGYRSDYSATHSGVTFASHRVQSLVLKAVRGYDAAGTLVFEESTPVVVFESE
jgi:hypothetical protein